MFSGIPVQCTYRTYQAFIVHKGLFVKLSNIQVFYLYSILSIYVCVYCALWSVSVQCMYTVNKYCYYCTSVLSIHVSSVQVYSVQSSSFFFVYFKSRLERNKRKSSNKRGKQKRSHTFIFL